MILIQDQYEVRLERTIELNIAKMAFGKTLLSFGVILFLVVFALELRELQGKRRKNRNQAHNQTEMMELLKNLQARVDQLEAKLKSGFRGRPGRPGRPGRIGKHGPPGPKGARGVRGSRGYTGPKGSRGTKGPIGPEGPGGPKGDRGTGGVQYVRWGRTTCPYNATLVYNGRTGGQYYTSTGGASNYVCLTLSPTFGKYKDGTQGGGSMYGAEYETASFNPFTKNLLHHDAPCVVCHVQTRSTKMMTPGTFMCPAGWTREYWGYLMSANDGHKQATEYICVDKDAEYVTGSGTSNHGVLLYTVEGRCGSLPCLPYVEGRELTCAVCTK